MNRHDPWKTREEDFWTLHDPEARGRFLLNYAVMAPSTLNTQPWLFTVNGDTIQIFADRRRGLSVADPDDRQLVISCGAALYHLKLAMRRFGRQPAVQTFPDLSRPDLLAVVRAGLPEDPAQAIVREFEAMKHRHAQGSALAAHIPAQGTLLNTLSRLDNPHVQPILIDDGMQRQRLAEVVYDARRAREKDRRYQRERAAWQHPDRKHSRDGLPVGRQHYLRETGPEPQFVREFADGGPAVFVLASRSDSHASWLETGQVLAQLLLAAAGEGLAATFHNEPLELGRYRKRVNALIKDGLKAQVVLRVGLPESRVITLRRPVNEVLLNVY
ncbi:MAG: hypothetical protein JJ896_08815 [Rhodothermales bacterium]|nr:hypothetical protein [Rhodothermales bacterium]MBO6779739.1 hypothetical protein [Rhodothermales bacterium]